MKNQAELARLASGLVQTLKPNGLLWLSYPKGSSKIQTDLTRDKGWEGLQGTDLR